MPIIYDILLVSNAKDSSLYKLTENTIKNLRQVEDIIKYNIVVIEQQNLNYSETTLHYDFPFNYHRCLNYGISKTENPYVILCNNDLVFEKHWAENLYKGFLMGYRSVSPYCKMASKKWLPKGNHLIEGYHIGIHITGWCIGVDRKVIQEIGGLNEEVEFWYSDNIYGEQIKRKGIPHAIVCNSYVTHMESITLNTYNHKSRKEFTGNQKYKYDLAVKKLSN